LGKEMLIRITKELLIALHKRGFNRFTKELLIRFTKEVSNRRCERDVKEM
jgi:hypothetical protein